MGLSVTKKEVTGLKRRKAVLAASFAVLVLLIAILVFLRRENAERAAGRDRELLTEFTADRIAEIELEYPGGEIFRLKRTDGIWECPDEPSKTVDQMKASTLAASITGVSVTRVIDGAEDAEQYGLTENVRKIRIKSEDGQEVTEAVGASNDLTMDVYCMKLPDTGTVYAVSPAVLAAFDTAPEDYFSDGDSVS